MLLGRNEIQSLRSDTFHGLVSLRDIHLQRNAKWEMYCDYDFGDRSLFPNLKSLYIDGAANQCVHPWLQHLMETRPDLNIEYQEEDREMESCQVITLNDLPSSISKHTTIQLQFEGPQLFFGHKAYWISENVDKCSDFRDILNFESVDLIGHPQVSVADDGVQEFTFSKAGRYFLVYKYGAKEPFLPYFQYSIEVKVETARVGQKDVA